MRAGPGYMLLALLAVLPLAPASADDRYPPVADAAVLLHCGSCHMPYQPALLPVRSWSALLDGLPRHFGKSVVLDAATRQHIKTYFKARAADAHWWGGRFMRGLRRDVTPLRITDTPYWRRKHSDAVSESAWRRPAVGSPANCPVCHRRAAHGEYGDD